jgi:hypothetical protein
MRPYNQQGSKLAYIQRREDAKRKQQESQRHHDSVQITSALNRVADQLLIDEQEEEGRDSRKATREKLTIFLVFATVVAAGIGDVFFYGQMSEMQKAYGPIADQANAAKRAADAATKQSEIATRQAETPIKLFSKASAPGLAHPTRVSAQSLSRKSQLSLPFSIKTAGASLP